MSCTILVPRWESFPGISGLVTGFLKRVRRQGGTGGVRIAYPSGAPEFITILSGVCVSQSLVGVWEGNKFQFQTISLLDLQNSNFMEKN